MFFCESFNAGKVKLKKYYLLTLILLIEKVATFEFDIALWDGKFNQENMYQTLSELASFCKTYDKYFAVFFGSQF